MTVAELVNIYCSVCHRCVERNISDLRMDYHENISARYLKFYDNKSEMETSALPIGEQVDNITLKDVPLLKQPEHMIIIYCIAYSLVICVGLIGNGFVIAVIYKDPSMRNVTNYFILNMSVADVLVALLCVPFTLLGNIYSGESKSCTIFISGGLTTLI